MDKLERLLNLTALLLNTERPLQIEEIGQLMEGYPADPASFRRTFERDKDDLRELGVPIDLLGIDGGDPSAVGYRILPDRYYLPDPGLEPDELTALKLALRSVQLEGLAANETLRKLGASQDTASPNAATAEAAIASVPTSPEIATVHQAIMDRRVITFGYHGELRTVEPDRLDYQRGRWYLGGFDQLRAARRSFRVDRIEGSLVAGEPGAFTPEGPSRRVSFDPWRHGDDPVVTARLLIDADQADSARMAASEHTVWTDQPDGSAIAEMSVSNRAAFRHFVLGFIDHAEILEPPELRDDLLEWLDAMAS